MVGLEHYELWGGLIDLDPKGTPGEAASLLEHSVLRKVSEDQMALREGLTYVPRLVRRPAPETPAASVNPEGRYLITGGLGDLGLKMARWLVDKGARHITLLGRRQVPERSRWAEEREKPG